MADGNRAAAAPLRGRIPTLAVQQLQPLREFFQRHQHWLLPDNGTLRFAPGHPVAADEVFELDADGTRLGLRLQAASAPGDMPHWSDYRGRARVLAWSLAHERWLMRLSEAFGVVLTPLLDSAPTDGAPVAWLDFLVEDDDADARVPGAALLQGSLRVPAAWLPRLLAQAAPPYADEPPTPLGRWRGLPVRLLLLLDVPPLPADDWAALRPGDVLVIGARTAPLQLQARGAGHAWPVAATAQGWRIEGAAQPLPPSLSRVEETGPMSEQHDTAAAAPEDPDAGARPLPVRLSFEVGALDLRIGDLAELQPGYVFALPAHLEGANVVLRANGEAVGQGELVAVGDTLGVRLIAWT
ncbi:YscQ/HrcQ family type III secretion apparatus protein [Luteimonas yindakuii]|uniref:type III secretion system cytoplasmic ring protein SctQ n=1 Tax=Luteimonas yindakuii TaxID=2565782 RepID=UPI00110761CB|nr:type III secretion system cytoplasmic ring protein SctQ [Luteimonas yindakuii]QCO68619.2 YscQ/HrcQ family type III secretion apparatus protein [Luteimonas yindakuii]